jgi:prevent-host-death family protein
MKPMKTVNMHEAKTKLSALVVEVAENGETYVICRNGKPVADLVPHVKKGRLSPHPVLRRIRLKYDPTEPLTPDEWPQDES